ncbi:MAG: hypothetical protein Kow0069_32400 [Promethearchaeota archaeon]
MPKNFPLDSAGFHPFGELLGLRFTSVGGGSSTCVLEAKPALFNPHGVLHGAAVYALVDTGMGAALYSELADDESCATIEVKVNYLRPVMSGEVTCRCRVVHRGRSVAVLEAEVACEGRPVARALGTFSIFPAE